MEHVVDELGHLLRPRAHTLEEVDTSLVERAGAVVGQEGLAEAVDRSQRRTEVVRHGIRERLQLPVCRGQLAPLNFQLLRAGLQLPGAVCHPVLKRRPRLFDLRVLALNLGQHLVEGTDELFDLGRALHGRSANGIVLPVRDGRGERREAQNRPRDGALRQLGDQDGDQQRGDGHQSGDERKPPPRLIVIAEVHVNEERSQRPASGGNRPVGGELMFVEAMAGRNRLQIAALGNRGTHSAVHGEHAPIHDNAGRHHGRAGFQ